jgi:hypothetical protein
VRESVIRDAAFVFVNYLRDDLAIHASTLNFEPAFHMVVIGSFTCSSM